MIEVDLSNPWLAIGVGVFVLLVMIVAMIARRSPRLPGSTDAKLDALDRRLGLAEKQLETADHDLRQIRMIVNNLPNKESIHQIGLSVAESRGKIEGMQMTLMGQTKTLDRIEEFLMKAAGDAIVGLKPTNGAPK